MARFAIVDQVWENARLLGEPLAEAGHALHFAVPTVDFRELMHFEPQIVVASLYKRSEPLEPPPWGLPARVAGFESLLAVQRHQLFERTACVVIGHGVEDGELGPAIAFDLFLACQVEPSVGLPVAARVCIERSDDLVTRYLHTPAPVPKLETGVEVVIRWGTVDVGG